MTDDIKVLRPVTPSERGDPANHPDFIFFCPGCKCAHGVWTTKKNGVGAVWTFNGNMEKPTFAPSILVSWTSGHPPVTPENMAEYERKPWPQTDKQNVCHSYVKDGAIQFLGDCTHEFAGQTIPMEPF